MTEKGSVLIVDDNVSLLKTMFLVMKKKGYACTTASDGLQATQLVQERPFDVVFMDVKMPLMDGVETYRRVKKIRPGMAVIMMTAYAVEDLIQDALREGAFGVIYKPFDFDKIVSLIDEARESRKSAMIMVVDDDNNTCTTIHNILTKKGYRVGIANTGEQAISMIRENGYDVLIIDMKLPTINGLETFLAIREINPEAVAIMTTAYRLEMDDLVKHAIDEGAIACIYKPIDMDEMLEIIDRVTKVHRRG